MMKPKLKEYCRYVMSREDGVIRFKMERTTLEIPDPEGRIYAFINLLDGAHTKEDIAREMNLTLTEVEEGIASLDSYRILESMSAVPAGLTEREQLRYKNNYTYFSLYENMTDSRFDYQRKLKNAKVAVIGLGGGSVIAAWLAAMGVGTIIGVDFDKVELNNLNRQFFYTEDDVGDYKTSALKRRLNRLNSDVKVEVHHRKIDSAESLMDIVAGADLVVSAIDTPPLMGSRFVNSACLQLGIPSYYVSIGNKLGFYYRVLPFESGCTDCRLLHIMRTEPELLDVTKQKWFGAIPDVDFGNPGFAPNVAIVTSLIASEIAKHLTGYGPTFELSFGLVNFQDMQVSHRNIPKSSDCPSCGRHSDPRAIEPIPLDRLFSLAEADGLTIG